MTCSLLTLTAAFTASVLVEGVLFDEHEIRPAITDVKAGPAIARC